MEALIIQKSEDTPQVELDLEKGVFTIEGRSLPENAIEFYKPVLSWVEEALEDVTDKDICIELKLEYFNTASSKQIAKLFLLLENYIDENNINVKWYYEKEDNDMLISGTQYAKFLNLKFDFIEYEQ